MEVLRTGVRERERGDHRGGRRDAGGEVGREPRQHRLDDPHRKSAVRRGDGEEEDRRVHRTGARARNRTFRGRLRQRQRLRGPRPLLAPVARLGAYFASARAAARSRQAAPCPCRGEHDTKERRCSADRSHPRSPFRYSPPSSPPAARRRRRRRSGRRPQVTVITVQPQNIPFTPNFVAQTESSRQVNIVARVSGYLDKIAYQEGEVVKEGQLLFQLDPKPFQAQLDAARGELQSQQARFTTAEANLEPGEAARGAERAVAVGPRPRAGRVRLGRRRRCSPRSAKVTEAELNLGYTTIRSPVTGLASRVAAAPGRVHQLALARSERSPTSRRSTRSG